MFRRRVAHHRHLLTGSAVLVIGAGVQAVFGALFWLLAARSDTTSDVGEAAALFTSVLFVVYLAGFGLPVALARYAPGRDPDSYSFTGWSLLVTGVGSALISFLYVAVVRTDATEALSDWHSVGGPIVFALLAVGAAWSLLIDVRWMTVRRWGLVLVRLAALGLARLPLLALPVDSHRSIFLFIAATGPPALSGYAGALSLARITGRRPVLSPRPRHARAAVRYSMVNWLSTLAYQAPQFALPVIVLTNVSSDQNASFYVAWGVVQIALYIPLGIGQALLAEGGKDGAEVRGQVRVALALAVGLMAAATLATDLGNDLVTAVYGEDYSDAARVLPGLVAGTIAWAVTSIYLTEARVRHRHVATVAITLTLTAATLVPALILVPDEGLDGATQAFLVGNIAAAVVAFGCHLVVGRTVRGAPPEPLPIVVAASGESPA
jgi:O-antigen/teichoic acid export membrane protein